jgi:hypothetical protein
VFRRCERSLLVGKRHRTMRYVPSFNSRQTAEGTCADRRCSRVQRRREGPTVVPTPAFRDFQSLCSRAGCHGGLTPPALGCTCVCASQKSPFHRHAFAHSNKSGGRQPAVGVGKMFTQTKARLFGRPPRVRVPMAVAFASRENTGANAPRSCIAARTFAGEKSDFCDARTHVRRSGGREPAVGVGNALATPIPRRPGTRHVRRQERRASARRGRG